jgi:ion channel-forming bestrophin family protein
MYVKREIDPEIIWFFAWKPMVVTAAFGTIVYLLFEYVGFRKMAIPFLPIATVGTAVAFYVGFKNNSSYDRLWEARKIWGEITNVSRSLASYVLAISRTEGAQDEARRFVHRHIAFVNILRMQLRRRSVWQDSDLYVRMRQECFPSIPFEEESLAKLTDHCTAEETAAYLKQKNIAKEILKTQMKALTDMKDRGWMDACEHSDVMRMCAELYNQQGKAERIKSFPFPRQYAYFSEVFVDIFIFLLPFGLIGEFFKLNPALTWLTIPFTVLIAWIFKTMEKVGDTSENPFENNLNDIPMSAICRNIEIDLREMMGEDNLPAPLEAVDNILM